MKPETNEEKKARIIPKAIDYIKTHRQVKASKLSALFGTPYFCFIWLTDDPCFTHDYLPENAWGNSDFIITYKELDR